MTTPKRPATTDFDVEPVDPARSAQLLQIHDLHTAWTEQQIATGVPFNPGDYKAGSDYNVHTPDLEASGEAEDDLATATAEILRGPTVRPTGPASSTAVQRFRRR